MPHHTPSFNMILATFVFIILFYRLSQVNYNFALSPSFVRQEIVAAPKDWKLWNGSSSFSTIETHDGHSVQIPNAKNLSECTNGDQFF